MTQKEFIALVRPAFNPEALLDDIEAVLKRTNVMVNSKTHIYLRPAGLEDDGDDVAIRRFSLENGIYITKAAKEKLQNMGRTGTMPVDHQQAIAEEMITSNYLKSLKCFFREIQ